MPQQTPTTTYNTRHPPFKQYTKQSFYILDIPYRLKVRVTCTPHWTMPWWRRLSRWCCIHAWMNDLACYISALHRKNDVVSA